MGETCRSWISAHYGSTAPLSQSHIETETQTPTPYVARPWTLVRFPDTHISSSLPSLAAAATGSVLHTLALADGDCGLGVGSCGTHALLDLAGHGKESLLDVGGALCRGLEEWNAEAVCELL